MTSNKIDFGSLDYWDGEDEFSLHQAVCLWLDYKPEDGGIGQKFPSDLKMALKYFLSKAKEKELTVWPCHEYERDMYRELFKNRSYPFNPDEPADMSDGAIERAFKKRGLFSYLGYRVDTLPIFDDPKDDKIDPELTEAERYYHGFAVWRKDLIRLAEKINHKPLFLSPPELRQGKTLREIWPTIPTISVRVENKEKTELSSPKKPSKLKLAAKKKKTRTKPETTSIPKTKPTSTKKAAPDPDTGKGKIQIFRHKVEAITRSALREKPAISTPDIFGSSELKLAISEHSKKKWPEVAEKTINNWIRAESSRKRGERLKVGRPSKK